MLVGEMLTTPCDGCALTCGAAANREPDNALKAQICVLGAIPFYCHDGIDWRDPLNHLPKTRAEFRRLWLRPCAGWQREVRALAAAGYFSTNRSLKRGVATAAFDALQIFTSATDQVDKEEARQTLERCVVLLVDERDKAKNQCASC